MRLLFRQLWVILHHDVRLLWRELRSSKWNLLGNVGLVLGLLVAAQAIALLICLQCSTPPPLAIAAGAWMFFGCIMLGTAMAQAIAVLFEKADFSLLFAAPVSPHAVLLARMTALVVGAFLSVGLFLLPLLNGLTAGFGARYALGFLVWLELAGLATAAGVGFTLTLVRWLGARRARVTAQVCGAVVGALVYLGLQAPTFLGPAHRPAAERLLGQLVVNPVSRALAQASAGATGPLLTLGALTLAALALTTWLLAHTFIVSAQEATLHVIRRSPGRRHHWHQSLAWATFWKDTRLILRDPLLLSQVLPSVLYLLPALLGLFSTLGLGTLAPLSVIIAGQLSAQLALVATAGEEGWDLIRMSPTPELHLRLAKLAAGTALPLGLTVLLCLGLAVAGRPGLALLTLGVALICAAGNAWLQVSTVRPSPRQDVLKNRLKNTPGRTFGGIALMLTGATAVSLVGAGHWLGGSLALAACLLGFGGIVAFVRLRALFVLE